MRLDSEPTHQRGQPDADPNDWADGLPDELAQFAQALADDAARLADRYSADAGLTATSGALTSLASESKRTRSASPRSWRAISALAAIAASAVLAVCLRQNFVGQHEAPLADQG